ncbi:Piso0_003069 [Millerozyma farinosa CBS 7064]|uniref:CTP synthase n=1 Tax=Pichia sorbitophila (strain ATCC MYA-4447 / BCRC 22081 / CBS 7064 / NBRC 10061 / NRRL Y-12695) TaxID=559304 RepID=G8YK96_PICSO|nr:Piso0_003069 [Millerozyma farinosa CBS 7064]CCE80741.1 Piso0_003069 [Millerozyma farinosa CBS 7064]
MKYVVVSGGVISGIGKGVLASSTGVLFKTLGYRVTSIKIDPYMNIDAGTMSPLEHGECFVLNDGGEVDLDLGNYERYLNITLTRDHNITTGKIYSHVIEKERKGDYLGKTVQVVPHITSTIQDWIQRVAKIPVDKSGLEPEVCIIELGGTVGDIESAPFVEALRQFQFRVGVENFALIHVSLVPVIHGEQKTKPTQAAIKDLRSLGLTPDMIACRCQEELDVATIEKIGMFCHVGPTQVIAVHDVPSTYHVPLLLKDSKVMKYLGHKLHLNESDLSPSAIARGEDLLNSWRKLTSGHDSTFETVTIALVGKYTNLKDSYLSVIKALEHASMRCKRKLNIEWVESTDLEEESKKENLSEYHKAWHYVCQADGILVPGGFGSRGIEGMIATAKYARENNVPYLGVCLGLQVAVIEWVRNVMGIKGTSSMEFDPSLDESRAAVVYMPDVDQIKLGGTMRLGIHSTMFSEDSEWSKLRQLYGGAESVLERHRHRYEVNPSMIGDIEASGLKFIGKDESGKRMEVLENPSHKFFCATQYHPEYLSKVLDPSRPFLGLVAASSGILDDIIASEDLNYKGEF